MTTATDINVKTTKRESRFTLVFKKYITENWKMLVYGAGAYLAFWAMIGAWLGWVETGTGEGGFIAYIFVSSTVLTVLASLMFRDMNGKEKRISTLMTPASASDKFWIRFIFSIPVPMILAFAGYFIFEWFRMLACLGLNGYTQPFFYPSMPTEADMMCVIFCGVSSYLLTLSLYSVGAICWPKYSFLKTTALEFGIQMIFLTIATILVNVNFILITGILLTENDALTMLWSLDGILMALAIAGWWFTYYKLKTKTL